MATALAVLGLPGAALAVDSKAPQADSGMMLAQAQVDTRPVPLAPAAQAEPAWEPPPPIAAPRMRVITLDPGTVARPVPAPPTSVADVPAGAVIDLPVNKTRPLDIPGDVVEIVVGSPEIADVLVRSPDQVFLMAKDVGHTNIFLLGRDGRLLRRIEINVHRDVETLRQMLAQLLPDEQIEVTAFGDSITLGGLVRNETSASQAAAIARRFVAADDALINLMRVAGEPQVLLRVRLAEIRRQVVKDLSIRFDYGPRVFGNVGIGRGVTPQTNQGGATFGGSDLIGPLAQLGIAHLTQGLALNISALENNGLVKTLAEPTLTARSGEEARVFSGREIPIVVETVTAGGISRTITYRGVGIALTFVPVIVGEGRIALKIGTEVSSLGQLINNELSFLVRRASTSVEMPSGGSMMIAGVLSNDAIHDLNGTPGLMHIPVLGALFRSTEFQRDESELVVTVEALIVEPSDPTRIAVPTDGFMPASDMDRYLLGRLHRVYGRPELPTGRDPLRGPLGYIMH